MDGEKRGRDVSFLYLSPSLVSLCISVCVLYLCVLVRERERKRDNVYVSADSMLASRIQKQIKRHIYHRAGNF